MKKFACFVTGMVFVLAQLSAQTPSKSGLTRLLESELARFPAKAGVYVKHVATGEEGAVRPDEAFNSMSVVKVPIMVMAYQLAEQKKLKLDERVEIRKSDIRGGSGIFRYQDVGLAPTVRDVIVQMIITSDNTATDLMIAKVGGVAQVNQWLMQSGYSRTKLVQTTFEFFRKRFEILDPKYKTLTPEQVYSLQNDDRLSADTRREWSSRSAEDQSLWFGVMTPRETGRMLEAIERGTIASEQSCQEMKRIMRWQQMGVRRIPHFLDVPVAHKTGDGPPIVANDAGMVYAKSGPIIIAFFTAANTGPYAELEDRIGRMSRIIVDYFDGTL